MDRDGKPMISCALGDRSAETAREVMFDLAGRLAGRVELATDGCGASLKAVTDAFSRTVEAHAWPWRSTSRTTTPAAPAGRSG